MRAAFMTRPGDFEVRDMPDPEPGPGRVSVRVRACGICGTDLHYYRGHFGPVSGICLGHEMAGEAAAVGGGVTGVAEGDRVCVEPLSYCRECSYCRSGRYQLCPQRRFIGMGPPGGLAGYVDLPAYAVHPLPAGVDFELGALAEPLAVAVHGLRLAALQPGERVLVVGAGSVGLLAIAGARALGASSVVATARHPQQAAAAARLGALVLEGPPSDGPDVAVETVGGDGSALQQAIEWVRPGGRVAVLGLFQGNSAVNASLIVVKEVVLTGGVTYGHAEHRSDFDLALDIVRGHGEDLRPLITHRFALEEVAQAFATAADKSTGAIKVSVRP